MKNPPPKVDPSERLGLVPALDPGTPYYSRLSARSALYTDLRLLLEDQEEVQTAEEYRRLVLEENCLARQSTSARRKLWKELRSRYRLDAADPLYSCFWTEWQRCRSDPERGLTAYILFALNDRLVFELAEELLFPLLRRAPADLRVADVIAYIERKERANPGAATWSEQTTLAVAQKYCASIRDFGLATGAVRKTTVRPALYGAPVRLLVEAQRLVGTTPAEIAGAKTFRLLGIDTHEVIDMLGELNSRGDLRFRMQADVIELETGEVS